MLTFENVLLEQGSFQLEANFAIPEGVTAIIGPSGGGKSTLLSAVAGFLAPMRGQISWKGAPLTKLEPSQRPFSMLFQDNNLFAHMTIGQNVGLGLQPNLKLTAPQWAEVEAALLQVGLAGFSNRKPSALSGGQQSRAALARVLVSDRSMVLLDEPFAALGPALKIEMLELVRDVLVASGQSVFMVTHDPKDAQYLANHVVLVADGRAEPPRETADIFANPPDVLQAYLGDKI